MEGFISSALATLLTHPFDVLKIQVQANGFRALKFGPRDAYRGICPQLSAQAVFYGTFFTIDRSHSLLEVWGAATVASTVANPLFVVKVRAQTGLGHSMGQIWRQEGFSGFSKGLLGTYANNMKLLMQFPLYARLVEKEHLSVTSASFLSKLAANTIFYPTDTVRTLIRNNVKKISIRNTITRLHSQRGFYRGFLWYNAFSIPNFVLVMTFRSWLFGQH